MTKAEKSWLDAITRMGCVVCLCSGLETDGEPHHILSGGRRIDHMHTICLCPAHHRSGRNDAYAVSRHPWRREFEARYGTEQELLAWTREGVMTTKGETNA